jgi:hypothetical protein
MRTIILPALIAIGMIALFVAAQNQTQGQTRKRASSPEARRQRPMPTHEEIAAAFKKYDRVGLRASRRTEVLKSPAFLGPGIL